MTRELEGNEDDDEVDEANDDTEEDAAGFLMTILRTGMICLDGISFSGGGGLG